MGTPCSKCSSRTSHKGPNIAIYCCEDCFRWPVWCSKCIVDTHLAIPFHDICKWEGGCFQHWSLISLGMEVHLGHSGQICPLITDSCIHQNFTVTDTYGIHKINVVFCRCAGSSDHVQQLLRAKLFPATTTQPSSVFTFKVLCHFHKMTNESGSSAYSYFQALRRLTNDINPTSVPVRLSFSLLYSPFKYVLGSILRIPSCYKILGTPSTTET